MCRYYVQNKHNINQHINNHSQTTSLTISYVILYSILHTTSLRQPISPANMSALLRTLTKLAQDPACAAAAVATASALAIACSTSPQSENDSNRWKTNGGNHNISSFYPTRSSVCQCEQQQYSHQVKKHTDPHPPREEKSKSKTTRRRHSIRSLRRMQTIRRLDLHSTKGQKLHQRYQWSEKDDVLGEGAYGTVYLARNKVKTNEIVALKKMPKKITDDEGFQREMRAMMQIRDAGGHPHVCGLRENFDDRSFYYLIMDYVGGGEMFDHLIQNGAYSERDAARLVREVASALSFLHGIGVVHADLKPENVMLSTTRRGDSVVKLVDFGCAQVLVADDESPVDEANFPAPAKKPPKGSYAAPTPAYCPPETLDKSQPCLPPMDMWGLGVILYIMLTGAHPFDLEGDSSDEEVEERIMNEKFYQVPLRGSEFTQHLSESAVDLIEQLMQRDPKKRLTAFQMLQHPWVRGETATTAIIEDSDKKLQKIRAFKSKLQAKFFNDIVNWSDNEDEIRRKTSLIERSFQSLDSDKQGFLTTKSLERLNSGGPTTKKEEDVVNVDEGGGPSIDISDFQNLLAENMKNRFFPAGHVVYTEAEIGNHMYFINSGTVEVTTKDGSRAQRKQGDFFGEGALLHPKKMRSATIKCKTPVHAMEISREYFEKYISNSDTTLLLTLREKDKIRKRNRAKTILKLQPNLVRREIDGGEPFFENGDDGDSMFILEEGNVRVMVKDKEVLTVMAGNVFGEHSVMTGLRRNCSAICRSETGCIAHEFMGQDFRKLMGSSPNIQTSLRDLLLRREFKKAVVLRLKKEFPYTRPEEAFAAADASKIGVLDFESIANLMREMDPDYTDDEVREIIQVLDLTNSGNVGFDEFKKVFVGDIRTSESM
jgi:serine/threonine protein kinase